MTGVFLMKIFSFFRNASENRTQFFLVMGFIVLPLLAMIYVFVAFVMNDNSKSSERMKIPQQMLEAPQREQ